GEAAGREALGGRAERGDRVGRDERDRGVAVGAGLDVAVPVDGLAEVGARTIVALGVRRDGEHADGGPRLDLLVRERVLEHLSIDADTAGPADASAVPDRLREEAIGI